MLRVLWLDIEGRSTTILQKKGVLTAMDERKILILFAHPALQKSRANKALIKKVRKLPGVTFHDLYEIYPDFDIDVSYEQELLEAHDVIIFQHPFFWYSTPALLKEWQDLVLEHGWAYGSTGKALHGKIMFSVMTTGGREDAYQEEGYNRFSIRQLLTPIEQTANLCGMDYLSPFVVHGTHLMPKEEIERHANDYVRVVEALRDDQVDLAAAHTYPRLNTDLDALIQDTRR